MLTPSDIAWRLPVWHALSQLFLDTELCPDDYRSIAAQIARSGCSAEEAYRVLRDEVAPAFIFNLMGTTGEWAGWGEDTVQDTVLRSLREAGGPRWMPSFRRWISRRHVEREWAKLVPHLPAATM